MFNRAKNNILNSYYPKLLCISNLCVFDTENCT